jgi:hypothetical protein
MLASMLLHMVPAMLEVDVLTDMTPWWQGFWRMVDTSQPLTLNEFDWDGLRRGSGQW